jgi:tetratricopeptide (TPR) repeat protein
MRKLLVIILLLFNLTGHSQEKGSDRIDTLSQKLKELDYSVNQIQRDKINYQIEKDLLKETYSRNYETLNLLITLILGIIGVLGFLGLRDITSIKKEYRLELEKLQSTKSEFESKSKEFDKEKGKFEEEIRKIIETNDRQNNKIKILELKEKINKLIEDNKLYDASDYINAALEIAPEDTFLLTNQGIVNTRLNRSDKALNSFKKAFELDPNNETFLCNLIECYVLSNNTIQAEALLDKNKATFENKGNGGLKIVKDIFELFYKNDTKAFTNYIAKFMDKNDLESQKKRFPGWRFTEALFTCAYHKENDLSNKLKNFLWYLDGQINGNTLANVLEIKP